MHPSVKGIKRNTRQNSKNKSAGPQERGKLQSGGRDFGGVEICGICEPIESVGFVYRRNAKACPQEGR